LTDTEVLGRRDAAKARLDAFIAASEADLAPLLHQDLQAAVAQYELLKFNIGALDFLDLLIKGRDLVRDHPDVRRDLQNRFGRYYVDEAQDTDPLQAELLLLLSADDPANADWRTTRPVPGKLFLVGDPKQSLYRFRRADVALYESIKSRLCSMGAELLHLSTSFRSPPSLQKLVNASFAPAIGADPESSGYVALENARPEALGQPTIVALPIPDPYGDYGKVTVARIDASTPIAVAAFIEWLVNESGWKIEENRQRVSIQPRHVALLFRRLRNFGADVTRPYLRQLEARHIPHVLVGGRSFHDREEVIALRTALTAIEWPDDELSVFGTLRGPLFAIGDEALLVFRQQAGPDGAVIRRRLDPMRRIDHNTLDPLAKEVADALGILRRLHVGRNSRPIAQTITMLLDAVRAHAGIALWQSGEQALGNCQRLVDQARSFERRASSFRAFVEQVESDSERGHVDDAPIIEEGTEGVRAMTVHKAKGLDFPVVILVDPTCRSVRQSADRHVDASRSLWLERLCGAAPIELQEASALELERDRAESVRVAYVAATRARDLLVIPTCGDELIEGWYDVLNPLIYPAKAERRNSDTATGCPPFGEDSVRSRGPKGKVPAAGSVRPGEHVTLPDAPSIVWWDPTILHLDVEELGTLRHQRLLEAPADPNAEAASSAAYALWRNERGRVIAAASAPAYVVQTVTSRATRTVDGDLELGLVTFEHVRDDDDTRPGGRRFGELVHAVLAVAQLDAQRSEIERLVAVQGRSVGASPEEEAAAVSAIQRTLSHPILRRAADVDAAKVHRETPVMMTLEDGAMLEGVVDLAFEEGTGLFQGWTIVDFKTAREVSTESVPGEHLCQVALYCKVIAAATKSPTRGIVLVV
jgi:ATP-dependent helicase/nuclease subunit A